jgi:5,10-methylene-tetrahydrofolate dehydrogenase/methenyl tetrahydrofolate cyclohydrolase
MIIYGNELAASFKEKMKAEIETLKNNPETFLK